MTSIFARNRAGQGVPRPARPEPPSLASIRDVQALLRDMTAARDAVAAENATLREQVASDGRRVRDLEALLIRRTISPDAEGPIRAAMEETETLRAKLAQAEAELRALRAAPNMDHEPVAPNVERVAEKEAPDAHRAVAAPAEAKTAPAQRLRQKRRAAKA